MGGLVYFESGGGGRLYIKKKVLERKRPIKNYLSPSGGSLVVIFFGLSVDRSFVTNLPCKQPKIGLRKMKSITDVQLQNWYSNSDQVVWYAFGLVHFVALSAFFPEPTA